MPTNSVLSSRLLSSPKRRRDGLLRYANNSTSLHGEDGIIARIFQLLQSKEELRYCVDVGAMDGNRSSNTYALLVEKDRRQVVRWFGVLLEADPDQFYHLRQLHGPLGNLCLNVAVSSKEGSQEGLIALLKQYATELPVDFDFLCIGDARGSDYWILYDLWKANRYFPKVVCVAFNETMPNDIDYVPSRNDTLRHKASLASLVELASQNGYELVETTLRKAFFVQRGLFRHSMKMEVADTNIDALHEPAIIDAESTLQHILTHGMVDQEDGVRILSPSSNRLEEDSFASTPRQGNMFETSPSWRGELASAQSPIGSNSNPISPRGGGSDPESPTRNSPYRKFSPRGRASALGGKSFSDNEQYTTVVTVATKVAQVAARASGNIDHQDIDVQAITLLEARDESPSSLSRQAADAYGATLGIGKYFNFEEYYDTVTKRGKEISGSSSRHLNPSSPPAIYHDETTSVSGKRRDLPCITSPEYLATESINKMSIRSSPDASTSESSLRKSQKDAANTASVYSLRFSPCGPLQMNPSSFEPPSEGLAALGEIRSQAVPITKRPLEPVDMHLELMGDSPNNYLLKQSLAPDPTGDIRNLSALPQILKDSNNYASPGHSSPEHSFMNAIGVSSQKTSEVTPSLLTSRDIRNFEDTTIDMSAYCVRKKHVSTEKRECASAFVKQLHSNGFALICGTGISKFRCHDALTASNSFLQEADESVRRSCLNDGRGYSPMCTESSGNDTQKDMVRRFRIGRGDPDGGSLASSNKWPTPSSWDEEACEYFRGSQQEYFESCMEVGRSLVCSIYDEDTRSNSQLGRSMNVLSTENIADASILTLMGCRRGSRHIAQKPLVSSYRDSGLLTLHMIDAGDCASLQQEDCFGAWMEKPLPRAISDDPIFLVTSGDCLSDLSKGYFPSNHHRILPASGAKPLNALAFSIRMDPSLVINSASKNSISKGLESSEEEPYPSCGQNKKTVNENFHSCQSGFQPNEVTPHIPSKTNNQPERAENELSWFEPALFVGLDPSQRTALIDQIIKLERWRNRTAVMNSPRTNGQAQVVDGIISWFEPALYAGLDPSPRSGLVNEIIKLEKRRNGASEESSWDEGRIRADLSCIAEEAVRAVTSTTTVR
jgi:isopenicillin N synthase-like dioxygenase